MGIEVGYILSFEGFGAGIWDRKTKDGTIYPDNIPEDIERHSGVMGYEENSGKT